MPADLLTRINLDALYLPFAAQIMELVAACRARGADYFAIQGYRTPEEQLKLWQQGRSPNGAVIEPKKVVTKLKFGAHNLSIACDFCRDANTQQPKLQPSYKHEDYRILAEEAERLKLESGFRWTGFVDPPHVQLPLSRHGLSISALRRLYWVGGIAAVHKELDRVEWF